MFILLPIYFVVLHLTIWESTLFEKKLKYSSNTSLSSTWCLFLFLYIKPHNSRTVFFRVPIHVFLCFFLFQPQHPSRKQKWSPAQTLHWNPPATPLPHRHCLLGQRPYQTKATRLHMWTKTRTMAALLWPNSFTTNTFVHQLWGLWPSVLEGLYLCDKSLFDFIFLVVCIPFFNIFLVEIYKVLSFIVFPVLFSGQLTMWK